MDRGLGPEATLVVVDEPDGQDRDAGDAVVRGGAERDACSSGLQRQHRGLEVHAAFGEQRDVRALGERLVAGREDAGVVARGRAVVASRDGKHPGEAEEQPSGREAPEVRGGEEAREPGQLGRHDHRVGEAVRVVGRDDRRLALDQARRTRHVHPAEDHAHDHPGEDLQESVGGRAFGPGAAHGSDGTAWTTGAGAGTPSVARPRRPRLRNGLMTRPRPWRVAPFVVLLLVAAGCGSSGSDGTASTVTKPAAKPLA